MENNFLTIEPVALTAISTDKASTVEFGGPKWVVQRTRCYGNISGLCMMCLYINIYIILHHGFNYGACKSHYDLGAMFLIRVWSQFDMGLFLQWLPSTGRDVSDFRSLSRQITVLIQLLAFSLSCIFWCAAVDWILFLPNCLSGFSSCRRNNKNVVSSYLETYPQYMMCITVFRFVKY